MKFVIYGSGCSKCNLLTANAKSAAEALGLDYEVEKVTDVNGIISAGIMHTPALEVDGKILIEGKVSSVETIKGMLG